MGRERAADRVRGRIVLRCVLSACLALLPSARGQLSYIQQNSAVNPLQGQSTDPEGASKEVKVYVVLSRLLEVNDNTYSFKVNFWWGLVWKDERAAEQIASNTLADPTYVCQAWCSTDQGLYSTDAASPGESSNATSEPLVQPGLCCDNVYVPGAVAQNVIGYDVSSLPVQYQLSVLPNDTISYRVQVQGEFYTNYNFKSYPFDRHKLEIGIQTQFLPLIDANEFGADFLVVYAENFGNTLDYAKLSAPITVDVYNSAELSQGQAWQIDKLDLQVMNYSSGASDTTKSPGLQQIQAYKVQNHGVRFIIHISRTSKGFYALMIIVPISLIILFSFVIFVLPITQIKGRLNIMATLFLTLIVLQFVLGEILPTAFTLIPPYYLLLVSYIYIFVLVGLAVFTNSLALQWQRRSARIDRIEAKMKFWHWIEELPPPPPGSKLKFGQLPVHHHHHNNPITEGKAAFARLLSRRFHSIKKDKDGVPLENGDSGRSVSLGGSFRAKLQESDSIGTIEERSTEGEIPTDSQTETLDEDFLSANGEATPQPRPQMDKIKSRPWTMKERSSIMAFLLRNEKFRWWSMWYYFIGRPESKEYCEFCAMKVEKWCLPILFVSYAAVVAIIFGVAQTTSTSNNDALVG